MIMKRRKFLALAGVGGLMAALVSGKFFSTTFEDSVVHAIKRELDFLNLDEKGLTSFARDFAIGKARNYQLIIKGYSLLGISSSHSGKIHHLVSTYMLSSDFFLNKMDEKRIIRYVGLYDPYLRPCAHPFSALRDENNTAPV
jgi:hypothetical protein